MKTLTFLLLLFPSAVFGSGQISVSVGAGVITGASGGLIPGVAGSTGATNGGTFANVATSGVFPWTNTSNAQTQNNTYSGTATAGGVQSDYLQVTNFGFSIPTGATINGIKVEVDKYANVDAFGSTTDTAVRLVIGGVIQATDKSAGGAWPTSDTDAYTTYGGVADTWSSGATYSDINASTFGVAISCTHTCVPCAAPGADTAFVDHVRTTIYYTTAAGQTSMTITQ